MEIVARKKKPEQPAGPRVILEHERVTVHHGDCLKVMASMPEASVDTIVTDPPYGLEFMGKDWDKFGREREYENRGGTNDKGILPHYGRGGLSKDRAKFHAKAGIAFQAWCTDWARAALRVAKPGAMLLAFGGTRTFHRLACAIEDVGWELRDCMMWLQGQGFAKGINIAFAFEHELCERVEREVDGSVIKQWVYKDNGELARTEPPFRRAEADVWFGWNTALKPSYEPIILAMKPLDSTFAANALAHGVAGLNVDGGRVRYESTPNPASNPLYRKKAGYKNSNSADSGSSSYSIKDGSGERNPSASGRWPANVVLSHDPRCVCVGVVPAPGYAINRFKDGAKPFGDGAGHEYESEAIPGGDREVYACVPGCPVRMLDEQSGITKSTKLKHNPKPAQRHGDALQLNTGKSAWVDGMGGGHADSGGASRYFKMFAPDVTPSRFFYTAKSSTTERVLGCPPGYKNSHPTVKPLDLCRYLCRLTKTPTGGVVLDPFSGSGSIAVGALLEGRTAIAIELEEESANATVARVQAALKYGDKLQGLKKFKLEGRKKLKRRR